MDKIRCFFGFAGYDAQELALKRLREDYPNLQFECIGWSEIDKYAIKGHDALHPEDVGLNFGDICEINWADVPDFDLFTYSFPCTDISNAGKQMGLSKDSGTRSSLLWECEKAIEIKKPKYLLMENVAALLSDKFKPQLKKWCDVLESYGYTSFYQILNAKNYGVPQNRARVFVVSVLDCENPFYFPKPFKLEKRLVDLLESKVDERLYLSQNSIDMLISSTIENGDFLFEPSVMKQSRTEEMKELRRQKGDNGGLKFGHNFEPRQDGVSNTISTVEKDNMLVEPVIIARAHGYFKGAVYDDAVCPTIKSSAFNGNNHIIEPVVLGWVRDEKGETVSRPEVDVANCVTSGKRDNTQNYIVEQCFLNGDKDGCASTLTTGHDRARNITEPKGGHKQMGVLEIMHPMTEMEMDDVMLQLRQMYPKRGILVYKGQPCFVRRLSTRELYRLMDVDDKDIDTLLSTDIPKTQHAKMAGNSIVVNVLYHLFKSLFIDTEPDEGQQLKLF